MPLGGENEQQSENFGWGGGSGDSHSQVIIGTAGKPKTTLCGWNLVLCCCVFACKTTNQ